jgi:putative PIN family toxin of toxin-antitoxin system
MGVLLDTNVLIAAFITHGTCSDLFEHCIRQHKIIISKFILGELEGHLRKKFKFPEADVQEAMGMLNSASEIVEPAPLKESVCRDPDDGMVLATALSGNVDCLVSGDKDLTEMKAFENIPILKPSDFSAFEASRK